MDKSVDKQSYFYHPDHLGSSSLITDGTGGLIQHMEYVPFGEVFIDERATSSSWNTPFKFNGKVGVQRKSRFIGKQDEETGLYYYGARYYYSRTSVWLGVDPLAEKYPGFSPYLYCANNPIMLIDPDGREFDGFTTDKKGNVEYLNDDGGEVFDVLYSKEDPSKSGMVVWDKSILPALTKKEKISKAEAYDFTTGEVLMENYELSFVLTTASNKKEMFKLFFYLSENSLEAEWRMHETKDNRFGIGTYHSLQDSPTDDDFGLKTDDIKMMIHSHPRPSTITSAEKGLDYDMSAAKYYDLFYVYVPKIGFIYELPQSGNKVKKMKK